jgi:hypothetical protein
MKIAGRFVSFMGVVAALAGGSGCSSGSSNTPPTSADYDDVAQSLGALVATPSGGGEVGSFFEAESLARGVTPTGLTLDGQGSYSGVNGGLTYTYSVSCTDASGNTLPQCGPTTNDAVVSVSWSGTATTSDFSATVSRSGKWTLSGIQSGTATFGGSGSFTYSAQFTSVEASANLSFMATASYQNVTFDETSPRVTGGTIDYTVDASASASDGSASDSGSFTIDAVVTFGAEGSASLTLDGSQTYTVSATGTVTKT